MLKVERWDEDTKKWLPISGVTVGNEDAGKVEVFIPDKVAHEVSESTVVRIGEKVSISIKKYAKANGDNYVRFVVIVRDKD